MKYKIHFILAFLCILLMQQVKSQNNCSSAQNIQLDTTYSVFVDNDYWVSFTATDSMLPLSIGASELDSLTLRLYSGSCSNLTLIEEKQAKGYLEFSDLAPGNTYILRLNGEQDSVLFSTKEDESVLEGYSSTNQVTSMSSAANLGSDCDGGFEFKYYHGGKGLTDPGDYKNITKVKYFLDGDPANGQTYLRPAFYNPPYPNFTPTNLSPGSHTVQVELYKDDGTGWGTVNPMIIFEVHPSPDLDFELTPQRICKNDNMGIILNQPTNEQYATYTVGIPDYPNMGMPPMEYDFNQFQPSPNPFIQPLYFVNNPAGEYGVSIKAENGCGTVSQIKYFDAGLLIDFNTGYYCEGARSMFTATDECDPQYYPSGSEVIWKWEFGDGSIATSKNKSITHIYDNPGTYDVTLTATMNDQAGNVVTTNTVSKQIYVHETPDDIVLDGHLNNCDDPEKTYTIENYKSKFNYDITIDPVGCGTVNYNGGNSFTVTWDFSSQGYADIIIHAQNSNNGECHNTSVFRVVECCNKPDEPLQLNNIDSYSQLPQNVKDAVANLSGDITINGTLVIDENVTISSSNTPKPTLHFGGNAKIIVEPGNMLTLDNIALRQACQYMWDGIYVNDIDAELIVNNTDIYDAQNAIVSNNGGEFHVSGSNINDCLKGIVVKNYTPFAPYPDPVTPHQATMHNTTITGTDNLLYMPYQNKQSKFGMDISRVNDLTIGDVSDPNKRNKFENMYCGIRALNSYIKVYNNTFNNIHNASGIPGNPFVTKPEELSYSTALFAASTINPYITVPFKIEVKGDKGNGTNNVFDGFYRGIHIYNLAADIRNNELNNGAEAIHIRKPRSQTRVNTNEIGSSTDFIGRYGITAFSAQNIHVDLYISNNEIYTRKTGIRMRNLNSFSNEAVNLKAQANTNSIYFEADNYNNFKYGFRIQNCDRAKFSMNTVQRLGNKPPEPTDDPEGFVAMYGFSLESSNLCDLHSNSLIKYMGAGFRIAGNCNYSSFFCNEIQESNFGFVFDQNASLTDVGDEDHPTENRWFSNDPDYYWHGEECRKMDVKPDGGSINFAQSFQNQRWFIEYGAMNSGGNKNPEIQDPHIMDGPLYLTESASGAITRCASGGGISWDPDELDILRDEYFSLLVEQGYDYDSLAAQYNFYDAQFVYEVLREDPTLIDLGTVNDDYFVEFYDSVQQTVIGEIEDIEDLMEDDDLDSAILLNEQLDVSEDWNYYLQQVNRVYLNKYARGHYDWITDAELDMLEDIALTTPQEGGDAVYIARTMIGIDADDYEELYYDITEEASDHDEKKDVMVYPNPADNKVKVQINTDTGENDIRVTIYNINGKLVYSENHGADTYFSINTEGLKNGLYFVKVTNHHSIDESTKVMIHH